MIRKVRSSGPKPPEDDFGFYVPGTSIRGPFRAQAERIIRSLLPESAPSDLTACDPFEQDEKKSRQTLSCSKRLEKEEGHRSLYAAACPACKLFGCAGLSSRIRFTDAKIETGYRSVYRDMIGIDRFTGGVYQGAEGGGANMRFHVLENTRFTTEISVTNFELWQLGLLAYVFRDFKEGAIPIGFGKSKGFGQVRGKMREITLVYPDKSGGIEHLGSLMKNEGELEYYGILPYEPPLFDKLDTITNDFSLYKHFRITGIDAFWKATAPAFNSFIKKLRAKAEEAAA